MAEVFEELANLDRLIHEPSRLSILTALASIERADFLFLQNLTGLTGGNLSRHLSKLEEAGLVHIQKRFVDKRSNTVIEITERGKSAIENHWRRLETLHENSKDWKPE